MPSSTSVSFWMLRCHWRLRSLEILPRNSAYSFFLLYVAARYLYTRFLRENCKELKVYRALRKGLPQFSTDFLDFQKEPEELEKFAKLVKKNSPLMI
jgi:hypothetical protein